MADDLTPIEAEARFTDDGAIEPLAFVWNGRRLIVAQHGRRWRDDQGRYHFLVMTPVDEVWELLFDPDVLQWFVARRRSPIRTV